MGISYHFYLQVCAGIFILQIIFADLVTLTPFLPLPLSSLSLMSLSFMVKCSSKLEEDACNGLCEGERGDNGDS